MSAVPSISPAGRQAPASPVLGAVEAQSLFERHAGRIYGYCLNRLGGREEAEDAVQGTFLNAFRALQRGVVPEHEAAWLYKIAENVCLERHRSGRRRLEVAQDPTSLDRAAAPAHDGDELLGLEDALRRLAPRQRQVLLLREWKGLSYSEIATELKLSPGAVETLIFRARRSLAQNLQSPERLRSRLRIPGLQAGSLLAWLKSLLVGSTAAKVAAGVVVAGSAALAGSTPVDRPAPTQAPEPAARTVATTDPRSANAAPVAPAAARFAQPTGATAGRDAAVPGPAGTASKRPLPAGEAPDPRAPGAPPAQPQDGLPAPPSTGTPPAPPAATPLPEALPPPPVSLPVPPPPAPPLQLPELPPLPQVPPLPPAPQLPALPEVPALPQLPQLSQLPQLPELPQLPKLP